MNDSDHVVAMETVKLCPMCGGLAVVDSADNSTKVRCLDDNCGVSLTRFRLVGDHRAAAIVAWNRRAPSELLASRLSKQEPVEFPSMGEAYAGALTATRLFYDAASVEETNWTGWGEQTVPFDAEWRRVKAKQAFDAIRDADRHLFERAPSSVGGSVS